MLQEVIPGTLIFLCGLAAYVVFLLTLVYAIGFVGNLFFIRTIDAPVRGSGTGVSVLIDLLLLSAFALQHSLMARPAFKRRWTRLVPPALERSTYVLFSSLALILLFWQWRPLPAIVWELESGAARLLVWGLFGTGWLFLILASSTISHLDLFGLRQVYLRLRGREYRPLPFTEKGPYRFLRHPIMLGFLVVFWSAPTMTAGHLLFSAVTTGYILIGILLEERDLAAAFGEDYQGYRNRVGMLLPRGPGRWLRRR